MRGPWTFVAGCIYAPPLGEGVARGDFFVDCFSEDAARKLVAKLNEQQRAIPERRVRSSKPRPKRPTPRRSSRVRDPQYRAFVRMQAWCALAVWEETFFPPLRHTCGGRIEGAHLGERATSQKASDNTMAPVCRDGHAWYPGHLNKPTRRKFEAWAIDYTRAQHAAQCAVEVTT
jgi:hypothetical protein